MRSSLIIWLPWKATTISLIDKLANLVVHAFIHEASVNYHYGISSYLDILPHNGKEIFQQTKFRTLMLKFQNVFKKILNNLNWSVHLEARNTGMVRTIEQTRNFFFLKLKNGMNGHLSLHLNYLIVDYIFAVNKTKQILLIKCEKKLNFWFEILFSTFCFFSLLISLPFFQATTMPLFSSPLNLFPYPVSPTSPVKFHHPTTMAPIFFYPQYTTIWDNYIKQLITTNQASLYSTTFLFTFWNSKWNFKIWMDRLFLNLIKVEKKNKQIFRCRTGGISFIFFNNS